MNAAPAEGSEASRLVGRRIELDSLLAALNDAARGRGRLVTVVGEAGIGKTSLADESCRIALARHPQMLVAWGRCWEGAGAPAYWPWVQVCRTLSTVALPPKALAALTTDAAGATPVFTEREGNAEQARFLLFDTVQRFVQQVTALRPLVIVFDDLHWADEPSLRLLHFVGRELRGLRVLVICTYRDVEARRDPSRAAALARLGREGARLALEGLAAGDVGALMERLGPGTFSPDTTAAVHRATDGNPFFVDEVVRSLLAAGGRARGASGAIRIPDGVRESIRARLAPLGDEARHLLSLAAIAGRRFDLRLLEAIFGPTPPAPRDLLAEARREGIVREIDASGVYAFAHALIPETLRADLGPSRCMQLHWLVAAASEEVYRAHLEPHDAELAHHFFQAAPIGAGLQAVAYLIRAAARARRQLAFEEAVRLFEQASEALQFTNSPPRDRCELLLGLGDALHAAGMHKRSREVYEAAVSAARDLGATDLFAQAVLGIGHVGETGFVDVGFMNLLDEALIALGADHVGLRVRLLARQSDALSFAHPERRVAVSEEALRIARTADDPPALVRALLARHFALWQPGRATERLRVNAEAIHLCDRLGDADGSLHARLWRIGDMLELADADGFHEAFDTFCRLAANLRSPLRLWHAQLLNAMRAGLEGRADEAELASRQALALGEHARHPNARLFYVAQAYHLRWPLDRAGELEAEVRDLAALLPSLPVYRCALTRLYADQGRLTEAQHELAALRAERFAGLRRDGTWTDAATMLAETCVLMGDREGVADLYEQLLPYAGQTVVCAFSIAWRGPVAHTLGQLATALQRREAAAEHFDIALDISRRLGAQGIEAETKLEYARLWLAGDDADRDRAVVFLRDAERVATALGLTRLIRRVQMLRATSGLDSAAPTPSVAPRESTLAATSRLAPPQPLAAVIRPEGHFWTVEFGGAVLRLKDSRGVSYLAHLLRNPGRDFPAAELFAGQASGSKKAAQGDGGVRREQLRARLAELAGELEEAREFHDLGRIDRAQEEIESLSADLVDDLGVGPRGDAPAAERARVAVTKAISSALKSLGELNPDLRRHLARTIKTGRLCAYVPDPNETVRWEV